MNEIALTEEHIHAFTDRLRHYIDVLEDSRTEHIKYETIEKMYQFISLCYDGGGEGTRYTKHNRKTHPYIFLDQLDQLDYAK